MLQFQWTPAPALARATGDTAVIAWRGRILVLGGQGPSDAVHALDPITGVWEACAPMPEARSSHGAAVLGDRVYVFGGLGPGGTARDTVWSFDGLSWQAAGTMPAPRARFGLATHGERAYLFGGPRVDCFHPEQGWRRCADLPMAGEGFEAAPHRERILVAGGGDARTLLYDPARDRFTEGPPRRGARRDFALVPLGDAVVAAGGPDLTAELFDGQAWRPLPALPEAALKGAEALGSVWLVGKAGQTTRGLWRSTESAWRIDGDLRFHLASLGDWAGRPVPGLGFEPDWQPDITNIPLAGLQGLGFPVAGAAEGKTFYLKFFRFPEGLDPARSARRVLEPTLAFQMGEGEELRRFIDGGGHVVVKKGVVERTGYPFSEADPYPPLRAGTQEQLDESVVFSSLYVQPEDPAKGSADGVLAFHQELLELYRASFGAPEDLGKQWRFGHLRVPKEPMVFANYLDLPMPQDPERVFLSGLLLVYEDGPQPRVFEVGSVIRLPQAASRMPR